jgi:hypothetical protein
VQPWITQHYLQAAFRGRIFPLDGLDVLAQKHWTSLISYVDADGRP